MMCNPFKRPQNRKQLESKLEVADHRKWEGGLANISEGGMGTYFASGIQSMNNEFPWLNVLARNSLIV